MQNPFQNAAPTSLQIVVTSDPPSPSPAGNKNLHWRPFCTLPAMASSGAIFLGQIVTGTSPALVMLAWPGLPQISTDWPVGCGSAWPQIPAEGCSEAEIHERVFPKFPSWPALASSAAMFLGQIVIGTSPALVLPAWPGLPQISANWPAGCGSARLQISAEGCSEHLADTLSIYRLELTLSYKLGWLP